MPLATPLRRHFKYEGGTRRLKSVHDTYEVIGGKEEEEGARRERNISELKWRQVEGARWGKEGEVEGKRTRGILLITGVGMTTLTRASPKRGTKLGMTRHDEL